MTPVTYKHKKYSSKSELIRFLIETTTLNQTQIAKKAKATPACVCQIVSTYRGRIPRRLGNVRYKSRSDLARYFLRNTKMSQSAIARKVGVSQPCVAQLAAALGKQPKKAAEAASQPVIS